MMGGEQAASVLATVRRDNLEVRGEAWSAEEEAFKAPIREQYEREGRPCYASARLRDDGTIDPAETRTVLALELSAALNAPPRENPLRRLPHVAAAGRRAHSRAGGPTGRRPGAPPGPGAAPSTTPASLDAAHTTGVPASDRMSLGPPESPTRLNMRLDLPGTRRISVAAARRGVAAALLLLVATSVAAADFDTGVRAYNRGDYTSAFREFRALAEQGHAGAQFSLGFMYDNGEGVPEDDRQAAFWYRKAAEQGEAYAQSNLGRMYAFGKGVPEDDVRAYAWVNLAAAQGIEIAERFRAKFRQRMTPAQIAEG